MDRLPGDGADVHVGVIGDDQAAVGVEDANVHVARARDGAERTQGDGQILTGEHRDAVVVLVIHANRVGFELTVHHDGATVLFPRIARQDLRGRKRVIKDGVSTFQKPGKPPVRHGGCARQEIATFHLFNRVPKGRNRATVNDVDAPHLRIARIDLAQDTAD